MISRLGVAVLVLLAANAMAQTTAVITQTVQGQSLPPASGGPGAFDNGAFYIPGLKVDVSVEITRTGNGALTGFTYTGSFPAGWRYIPGPTVIPLKQAPIAGNTTIVYNWGSYPPALADVPITIKYQLVVPDDAAQIFSITSQLTYTAEGEAQNSGLIRLDMSPDPDFDNDGLPNTFEDDFGLDAFDPNDVDLDSDGDGLSNREEYVRGSAPDDANDPGIVRFVAPGGSTRFDDGRSPSRPWELQYALDRFPNTGSTVVRAQIIMAAGTYAGDYRLAPFVTLLGQACAPDASLAGCAVVRGTVQGAPGATLDRVVLIPADGDSPALVVNNESMTVQSCAFFGPSPDGGGTGIQLDGQNSGDTEIARTRFERLAIGVDIGGPIPKVWRSFFANLFDDTGKQDGLVTGILIDVLPAGIVDDGSFSDSTDSSVGYNTFEIATIDGGLAIVNRRDEELVIENNDWGTDDVDAVLAAIDGDADVEPILAAGSAVFAASLFCTVWDGDTEERITNGSVTLIPTSFEPVTQNENGVYGFSAIGPGAYSALAKAPGFEDREFPVEVLDGEFKTIIVPLFKSPEPEGEGEGEPEPPTPGCCQPEEAGKRSPESYAGDLFLGGAALVAMLAMGRVYRRKD